MFEIPNLKYKYGDLEPYFDEATMRLHHTKHHQAYVDKLNAALQSYPDLAKQPIADLLKNLAALPETVRLAVQNHGGGHWNHSFFWQLLTPPAGTDQVPTPKEKMAGLIDQTFGDFAGFQKQFKDIALNRFGSGWAWVTLDANGKIAIESTANQDTPLSVGRRPVLAADVWEHAYYLKYQNRRADYLDAFWHLVDWSVVDSLLAA